ncbi:MAG: exodeoxyribonuclease VII small subunit [Betaproteobacteria bacterium]|nr:exodeoxyribonuclease VII small subunit [Betaproteobacteria bacterium]
MTRHKSETPPPDVAGGANLPANFEQAVAELESLVQAMESGSLALEQSLEAYRRGAQLAAHCRRLLADVQQQVKVLEADLLKPFDADPEAD